LYCASSGRFFKSVETLKKTNAGNSGEKDSPEARKLRYGLY